MACTIDCRTPSLTQAHCGGNGCHVTFNSVSVFDSHRSKGRCRTPQEMGLSERNRVWGNHGTMPEGAWSARRGGGV